MLLASYQPIKENPSLRMNNNAWDQLVNHLGYMPYFCFAAENIEDMLIGSFFAAPNCPEKLIVFETNDFKSLDIVRWNQVLKLDNEDQEYDISTVFASAPSIFCEYLVPSFDNIIFEITLDEAINGNFKFTHKYEAVASTFEQKFNVMQICARNMLRNSSFRSDSPHWQSVIKKRSIKNTFEIYLLPFLYSIFISKNFKDCGTALNPSWIFSNKDPQLRLTRIYNPDESMDYKSYPYYEETYAMFRLNLFRSRSSFCPSRNSPCPCGSGLKYKRCCGKT